MLLQSQNEKQIIIHFWGVEVTYVYPTVSSSSEISGVFCIVSSNGMWNGSLFPISVYTLYITHNTYSYIRIPNFKRILNRISHFSFFTIALIRRFGYCINWKARLFFRCPQLLFESFFDDFLWIGLYQYTPSRSWCSPILCIVGYVYSCTQCPPQCAIELCL